MTLLIVGGGLKTNRFSENIHVRRSAICPELHTSKTMPIIFHRHGQRNVDLIFVEQTSSNLVSFIEAYHLEFVAYFTNISLIFVFKKSLKDYLIDSRSVA